MGTKEFAGRKQLNLRYDMTILFAVMDFPYIQDLGYFFSRCELCTTRGSKTEDFVGRSCLRGTLMWDAWYKATIYIYIYMCVLFSLFLRDSGFYKTNFCEASQSYSKN